MMLLNGSELRSCEGEVGARRRGGRRFWTVAEKRRLVAETLKPGASVSLVARRYDVNANQLFTWRRQARRGMLGNGLPVTAAPRGSELIPIEVAAAAEARPAKEPSSGNDRSGVIEIALASGVRVRVDALVDEPALRRVLAAIGSLS